MPNIRLSESTKAQLEAIKGSSFDSTIQELINKGITLKEAQINLRDYIKRIEQNIFEVKKRTSAISISDAMTPNKLLSGELKNAWLDMIMGKKLEKENDKLYQKPHQKDI